jgi:hypothetical protein
MEWIIVFLSSRWTTVSRKRFCFTPLWPTTVVEKQCEKYHPHFHSKWPVKETAIENITIFDERIKENINKEIVHVLSWNRTWPDREATGCVGWTGRPPEWYVAAAGSEVEEYPKPPRPCDTRDGNEHDPAKPDAVVALPERRLDARATGNVPIAQNADDDCFVVPLTSLSCVCTCSDRFREESIAS